MNQMTCRELGKRLKVSSKLQKPVIVTCATPCDEESTGPVMAKMLRFSEDVLKAYL